MVDSQAALGAAVRQVSQQLADAGAPEPYALAERIVNGLLRAGWRVAPALIDSRPERGPVADPTANRVYAEGRERARAAREAAEAAGVDQ